MQVFIDVLRFIAIGQITLLLAILLKTPNKKLYIWAAIFFGFCVNIYLLAYWGPIAELNYLFLTILPFSIAVPFSFWTLSKTIFDDNFTWKSSYAIWMIVIILMHTFLFLLNGYVWNDLSGDWKIIAFLPPYLLSMFFVIMGIFEALRNYHADLILVRLRFRYPFILISALVMFITLSSLMALQHDTLPLGFELVQKIAIVILTFYFSINQLQFKSDFFDEVQPQKSRNNRIVFDEDLLLKLNHQIEQEKIYRTESLTIRDFAEIIEVKEYKLRQLINQQLGFRNFNEFINSYRIKDACAMLLDKNKKEANISEIAFELGYTSLSPFNKAFKQVTGTSPKIYRKENLPS